MLERLDLQGPVAIGDFDADAAARRQRHDLVGREFALVQDVEHFPPDIAGRADHCDFVTHRSLSEEKCRHPLKGGKGSGSASMRETPSTQRYHGSAGLRCSPFRPTIPTYSRHSGPIRPALTSFADEVCATVARLFAYVGVLALFGILGVRAWDQLQVELTAEPASEAAWSVADRSPPAFALSRQDASDKFEKSDSYIVFRHPLGGRRDVLRWPAPDQKTVAELEIYRPGAEYGQAAGRAKRTGRANARTGCRNRGRRRDRE